MAEYEKTVSAFICALLVCTLLFTNIVCIGVVQADSVDKLPAPTLVSVTYDDRSYDVPASTTTDPFTGKSVENPAYHVNNRTLTFVIDRKNAFRDNPSCYQHYLIRMKGAFSNEWNTITELFDPDPISPLTTKILSLPSPENMPYDSYYFPSVGQAEFQVQAQEWVQVPPGPGPLESWVKTLCAESSWSNTKTVSFGQDLTDGTQSQPNHIPSQTSTNQIEPQPELIIQLPLTEFILVIVLCTTLPVLIIALIYTRKTARQKKSA